MTTPAAPEARSFYRSAKQRFTDGQFLLEGDRTTAAVYLGGYAVECMLKALILSSTAKKRRAAVLASFRGSKAHDFGWLKGLYLKAGGPPFEPSIARQISLASAWTTELRYNPGTVKRREAAAFLNAVEKVLQWADGRL